MSYATVATSSQSGRARISRKTSPQARADQGLRATRAKPETVVSPIENFAIRTP
jgi:hypothetical protein